MVPKQKSAGPPDTRGRGTAGEAVDERQWARMGRPGDGAPTGGCAAYAG